MSTSDSCSLGPNARRLVGDPVDTLTGAVFDLKLEFRLTGPLELWWHRHYDSSKSHRRFALGTGQTHGYDRTLFVTPDGLRYELPVGQELLFPSLEVGRESALHGLVLVRTTDLRYELYEHGQPALEFASAGPRQPARLSRVFKGSHQILFHYDESSRLRQIIDSAGRQIAVETTSDARVLGLVLGGTEKTPGRLLVGYSYDDRGNLVLTKNDEGHGYKLEYDDANRLIRRTGRKGFDFYFAYDSKGRCIRSSGEGQLHGVRLRYDVPGRLTRVTRADGGVWSYIFDQHGGLAEIVDPLGGSQRFIRDDTGQVLLEVDQNQNATRISYSGAGAPLKKTPSIGRPVPIPENPNAPDPWVHRVAESPVEYEYGQLIAPDQIQLPDGAAPEVAALSWNARQLVVVRSDRRFADVARFAVSPLGIAWWPAPTSGRVFNDLGQLIEQRDEFGRTRRWTYDASGNVVGHVDFDGGAWSYDRGRWHFLEGVKNPVGAEIRFTYTSSEQLASVVDAGGTHSEYTYDLNDHLIAVTRNGLIRERYARDPFGNLLGKDGSDGRRLLTYEIGAGNLPVAVTLASGDVQRFGYDRSGRLVKAATKRDSVEFAYDSLDNRIVERRNGVGVVHSFQGRRKPAKSTYFGRFVVRHDWADSKTLVVTDPGGQTHRFGFLGDGLVERRFSNGSRETAQYDSLGRCLFKCAESASRRVWSRRYHWSGEGELRLVEDSVAGETRHEYDSAHRLRRRVTGGRTEEYVLDAADNLIAQPGLTDVELGECNRLRAANGTVFTYNDRHHVVAREARDQAVRYEYDSDDQLVRIEAPDGTWMAEYDALGRRTRKTWGGQVTEYYWNTDQLIAETLPGGRFRLYVYADTIALTPLFFLDYDSVDAAPESCRRYFVFSDQRGAPVLIEDESGGEVWRAEVSPFGIATVAASSQISFNLRSPGHYHDQETGLSYNRFRYYDARLGRYLQSDPWGVSGGYNLYAYRANPLLEVDVRGLGEGNDPDCPPPGEKKPGAEGTAVPPWKGPTDYSKIANPKNVSASTKPTPRQVREMKKANREHNDGLLRDDKTGEVMVDSKKSMKGEKNPPTNEAQVDHKKPVDDGGTRDQSNLELRTRKNNRDKWNTVPGEPESPPPATPPGPPGGGTSEGTGGTSGDAAGGA